MIKINVGTLFRDSEVWHGRYIGHVHRFFNQIGEQQQKDFQINKVVCVEGNSKDNTYQKIKQRKNSQVDPFDITLLKQDSSYHTVKSTGQSERIEELATVGDVVLNEACKGADYIFWCESDLIIRHDNLLYKLFKRFADIYKLGVVAPVIFLDTDHYYFYDTWAFRNIDGTQWQNMPPWSSSYSLYDSLIPMNSIGSCCLIRADLVQQGIRFRKGALVNLCNEFRDQGYYVYVDKTLNIFHPSHLLLKGRWI